MSADRKDGGPAFPRALPKGEWRPDEALSIIERHAGMSLRDYFAAAALPTAFRFYDDGYCGPPSDEPASATVAAVAYEMADAMLKARER